MVLTLPFTKVLLKLAEELLASQKVLCYIELFLSYGIKNYEFDDDDDDDSNNNPKLLLQIDDAFRHRTYHVHSP
jgi:hypothetical protein